MHEFLPTHACMQLKLSLSMCLSTLSLILNNAPSPATRAKASISGLIKISLVSCCVHTLRKLDAEINAPVGDIRGT